MKKVLQIGAENFGSGGRSVITYNLSENLSEEFTVDFLCLGKLKRKEYIHKIAKRGGKIIVIDLDRKNIFLRIKIIYKLVLFIKLITIYYNNAYDIVHINADDAKEAFNNLFIAKLCGIKNIIVHAHATQSNNKNLYFYKKMINLYSDVRLACSKEAAMYMYGEFNSNITIIPNGIKLEKYRYDNSMRLFMRNRLGLNDDCLVIGTVGRITQVKNPMFIVDLIDEMIKCKNSIIFLWLGEGDMMDIVKEQIERKKLSDNFIFPGIVENVNDYLQAMDIFILPSINEGFGIANIEAQFNGLPCFVSTGIPKSVCINENFYRLDLNKSTKYWVSKILSKDVSRINVDENKFNKFDILKCSEILAERYMKKNE